MSRATDYLVGVIEEKDILIQSLLEARESIWNAGWGGLHDELEHQKSDPNHPITNTNPYGRSL